MDAPIIRELTPGLRDDYPHFFDRDAFADNPERVSRYCLHSYFAGGDEEWEAQGAADYRTAIGELTEGSYGSHLWWSTWYPDS